MKATDLSYLVGGILIGFGAAYIALEDRFGKKYEEMTAANRRAYERAAGIPLNTEETVTETVELDVPLPGFSIAPEDGTIMETSLKSVSAVNPYHIPVPANQPTPSDVFVSGAVTEESISYIEEEEYEDEEDGRAKNSVTFFATSDGPIFVCDGVAMDDWETQLGRSIFADFYTHCPPGAPPVLYVRNHKNNEDYEVVRAD